MDTLKFRRILTKDAGLNESLPLVIGFSGGPDSLCLVHLAHEAGFRVVAAHLDHGLRASSKTEAKKVKKMCAQLGVELIETRIDTAVFSRINNLSIEEGARVKRYRFLFDTAERINAQAVLVGHHADDQVETVLMHLLRGSGMSGFHGMELSLLPNTWSEKIPLVRPLLGMWRSEIEQYCVAIGLEPIRDESNADVTIYRNRIRRGLIPEMETYNPNFKQNLLHTIDILQLEDDFLADEVRAAFTEIVGQQERDYIVFNRDKFLDLHPAIQRRLIRQLIYSLNHSLRDIDYDTVEKARSFVEKSNSSNHLQLMEGMEMMAYFHKSILLSNGEYENLWPKMERDSSIFVTVPMETEINNTYTFAASASHQRSPSSDTFTARIDSARVRGQLCLRTFQAGDRFSPYGLSGRTQKLGDFWTNAGLPARARNKWPILCDEEGIIWVPGFRIADSYQVTDKTKEVWEFKILKSGITPE